MAGSLRRVVESAYLNTEVLQNEGHSGDLLMCFLLMNVKKPVWFAYWLFARLDKRI